MNHNEVRGEDSDNDSENGSGGNNLGNDNDNDDENHRHRNYPTLLTRQVFATAQELALAFLA